MRAFVVEIWIQTNEFSYVEKGIFPANDVLQRLRIGDVQNQDVKNRSLTVIRSAGLVHQKIRHKTWKNTVKFGNSPFAEDVYATDVKQKFINATMSMNFAKHVRKNCLGEMLQSVGFLIAEIAPRWIGAKQGQLFRNRPSGLEW